MSDLAFSSLPLPTALIDNLSSLGYEKMTTIQAQTLPAILAGKDVIGQGKTGSGKTAAFGLGLLAKLDVKRFRVQSLILCPTRELADQVAKSIRQLARSIHNIKVLTLCGGTPFGPQIGSLEHGAHIVVGTPGRIEEHLRKGNLKLDDLTTLVLDEADRMLEMGFQDAIDTVVEFAPQQRQTLLFSATYPTKIQKIAEHITIEPMFIKVESNEQQNANIEQSFYAVDNNQARFNALHLLIADIEPKSAVVFCNTKIDVQHVASNLADLGYSVLALHGDLEQKDRDQALIRFANKSVSILVATDVAARGLDIDSLDAVFNYQLAHDPEVHVHRIGRTGRAGSQGIACSLYLDKEGQKLAEFEDYLDLTIESSALPADDVLTKIPFKPKMATIQIDGGKKDKVRPGDILGALTGKSGIAGSEVGKIQILTFCAYVAVTTKVADRALKIITQGKLKGRNFRAWRVRG